MRVQTLDLLEALCVDFHIEDIDVQPNLGFGRQIPSRVLISLPANRADDVCKAVSVQLRSFPDAEADVTVADQVNLT